VHLVSIVIPTKDSANTIRECIRSAKCQSFSNIEIVVVDSFSQDGTVKICNELGCKVLSTDWKLLGARYLGVYASDGEYILMLDSDQILDRETVQKCLDKVDQYDMLCLEERTYAPSTFIELLFEADRKLVHREFELQLDPLCGTLLARFYRRDLLKHALESIPKCLLPTVVSHDHAIIYYEAYRRSKKVGLVHDAVSHIEPAHMIQLWKKNFRYGRSTKILLRKGYYKILLQRKVRLRKSGSHFSREVFLSSLLLSIKAPAYLIGLYL
jgi:glycosyltransferase involved in cell wall biosynthesis